MTAIQQLKNTLGNTDIYLIDQLLKERYQISDKILDAGCGSGRNLHWFYQNNFTIFAVDVDPQKVDLVKKKYPKQKEHFKVASLENLPFKEGTFNHIICNAVLHFSKNKDKFFSYFDELYRVLQPNGTLFIRMTSIFGMENYAQKISENVYQLPDNTSRFLLSEELLEEIQTKYHLSFIEPLKTVNVANKRSMSTLVFKKNPF